MIKHLLILNNGSSSLKFAVFAVDKKITKQVLAGSFSLVGSKSVLSYKLGFKKFKINYSSSYDLPAWWANLVPILAKFDIDYIGFRMVHGGEEFTDTIRVDKNFLVKIKKYQSLAPLHNPFTLALIDLVRKTWPRVKMSVSFDTAWHKGMPESAYLYSIPIKYYQNYAIRKYGFHGLSHEAASFYAAKILGKKLSDLKLITCHLGSGSSLTWYMDGKVIDTTMGFSPNEGLTMTTRSGDLPASIIFYLHRELKMSLEKIEHIIDKESGLLGISGLADLREVMLSAGYKVAGYKSSYKFSKEQRKFSKIALEVYIYDIRRYLAAYLAMSKKIDAIVFTGAVGENNKIRSLVLKGINIPKNTKIILAPEGEMKNLAEKTLKCLMK